MKQDGPRAGGAPKIYLAGPDVFRPDALARGAWLKALCAQHGAVGLYPLDNEIVGPGDAAQVIRAANMSLIRACDAVVADMTPFRGPGMDGGTAYEMGAAAALGKLVVGYTADPRPYAVRVAEFLPCARDGDGVLRDALGLLVEEFGACDNLMMAKGVDALFRTAEEAIRHAARQIAASLRAREAGPDGG